MTKNNIDKKIILKDTPEKNDLARYSGLISALTKINEISKKGYEKGGPVKPRPPINLTEYLELGVTLANLTEAERESINYMLEKLGLNKK